MMSNKNQKHLGLILFLQILGGAYFLWFLLNHGYLPSPFVHEKSDTFMDLFHSLHWADNPGRYTDWRSVYPPVNFLLLTALKFILLGQTAWGNGFEMRDAGQPVVVMLLCAYLLIPAWVVRSGYWKNFSRTERVLLYLIIILSPPMLFALERGNLVLLCLLFIAVLLDSSGWRRILCVALLINLKPYFVLLLLLPAVRRQWRLFLQEAACAGLLFMLSGLLLGDPKFLHFFTNLFSFSTNLKLFSYQEILAMPSSISFISFLLAQQHVVHAGMYASWFNPLWLIRIVETAKWGLIVWALLAVVKNQRNFSDTQITALLVAIITNLGIWVGGYSLIYYAALIPVLLRMRDAHIYAGLLAGMVLPLDFLPLAHASFGDQYAYITNSIVDVKWTLSLASMAKPFLNFALLAALAREFWTTRAPYTATPSPTGWKTAEARVSTE